MYELEGLYYLSSENKQADQLICTFFVYANSRFSHDMAHLGARILLLFKCFTNVNFKSG